MISRLVSGFLEKDILVCGVFHPALLEDFVAGEYRCFHNHGQGILDRLWFSCEIAHCRRLLISIFLGFLGGNFHLGGGDWVLGHNSIEF